MSDIKKPQLIIQGKYFKGNKFNFEIETKPAKNYATNCFTSIRCEPLRIVAFFALKNRH